jgi:hypothetical protein
MGLPPERGVVAGTGRRHAGIRVHRVRTLPADEVTRVEGIPVTTPGCWPWPGRRDTPAAPASIVSARSCLLGTAGPRGLGPDLAAETLGPSGRWRRRAATRVASKLLDPMLRRGAVACFATAHFPLLAAPADRISRWRATQSPIARTGMAVARLTAGRSSHAAAPIARNADSWSCRWRGQDKPWWSTSY